MSKQNIDPAVASLRARVAAHASWAKLTPEQRAARTAAARRGYRDRWVKLAYETFGDIDPAELAFKAKHLEAEHMARIALKSVQSRRASKAKRGRRPARTTARCACGVELNNTASRDTGQCFTCRKAAA